MIFSFFDKKHNLVRKYRWATDRSGEDVRAYLFKNCRQIKKHLGFATFKELTLNYRILFDRHNKKKIVADYKRYVLGKQLQHKSDVAMSYNIIKYIGVDRETERAAVNFMFERLRSELPKQTFMVAINDHPDIRKHVIMEYVKKHIIVKTPRINN